VLLINARSELMTSSPSGECTALAAAPETTAAGRVLLGQNWDWYTALAADPLLLHVHLPGGLQILTLVEAGQVGKIGLNNAGLGVCLNFMQHRDQGLGLPIHVLLRRMLECRGLSEAAWVGSGLPRGGAANVLLAHAAGEILDLELTAAAVDPLYGDAGWLVHANHFDSPRLRAGDVSLAASTSSLGRAARARRLLAARAGHVDRDTFQAILCDHAHAPGAICRHPDPALTPEEQTATRASLIMDLAQGDLHLAAGPPCTAPWHTYHF